MPFEYPSIYNFPPFFTKQPNQRTFESQLRNWTQLISDYCSYHKIWVVSTDGKIIVRGDQEVAEESDSKDDLELLNNKQIDRRLKSDFLSEIFKNIIDSGLAGWYNEDKLNNYPKKSDSSNLLIMYWYPLEYWSQSILKFIESSGNSGTIFTLYELTQGELVQSENFYQLHPLVLVRALKLLVSQNRAQFMKDEDGSVAGVKVI